MAPPAPACEHADTGIGALLAPAATRLAGR
jgi:hypothetical protein